MTIASMGNADSVGKGTQSIGKFYGYFCDFSSTLITLMKSKIRYNKADEDWSLLNEPLPFEYDRMSAMFVENLC